MKVKKSKDIKKDQVFMREIAKDTPLKPTLNDNTFKNGVIQHFNQGITDKGINGTDNGMN